MTRMTNQPSRYRHLRAMIVQARMTLPENAHDPLFSSATLRLGEIHWSVLKASYLMDTHRYRKMEADQFGFRKPSERTDFGKEVGGDEINWWVFRKEADIDELQVQTRRALEAVQRLKQASVRLRDRLPESYGTLVSRFREFSDHHDDDIRVLYEYVRWLEMRDIMAPSILFTYRVWGSTRLSDRWGGIDVESLQLDKSAAIRELSLVVLGLRNGQLLSFDRAGLDIHQEIYESMDPEDVHDVDIPIASVVTRAAWEAYRECATYFTCVRDSLRNILLDIEKRVEQSKLIDSDSFWRKFILNAVKTQKTEAALWDFKETLTLWKVKTDPEKTKAKVTFAEDVASLANARGGVLVVGLRDRTREIVGFGDLRERENRLKFASQVIANHIEYEGDLVLLHQVSLPGADGEKVCLVVIVAQACNPVGVHDGQGHYTYPVRRETGIDRVSAAAISKQKANIENDNHDFVHELNQFGP
jgi:hypothetical protein